VILYFIRMLVMSTAVCLWLNYTAIYLLQQSTGRHTKMSPGSTAVSSKCVSQAAMWLSEIWPRHATDTRLTSLAFTAHWVQTVSADVQITSCNGTSIPRRSLMFDIRGGNWTQPSVCDKRWPSCSQDVHQVWWSGIFCFRSTCMKQASLTSVLVTL